MNIICKDNDIVIRKLEYNNDDIVMIYNWLNQESVSKYYGDSKNMDFDYIKNKFIAKNTTQFK